MTKVLKMIFELSNGKNMTWTLADPKDDLTLAQATTVIQEIIEADFIDVNGVDVQDIKDVYIYETQKIQLT